MIRQKQQSTGRKIVNNLLFMLHNCLLSLNGMLHTGIMSNRHSDGFSPNATVMNEEAGRLHVLMGPSI